MEKSTFFSVTYETINLNDIAVFYAKIKYYLNIGADIMF